MRPRWHAKWRLIVLTADVVSVFTALTLVAVARFGPDALADGLTPSPGRTFAQAPLLIGVLVWLGALATNRMYSPNRSQNPLDEGRRLVTSGLGASVGLLVVGFLLKENPARSWLFGGLGMGILFVAIGRKTVRTIVARIRSRGAWMTPTVLVGRAQAKSVLESIIADTSCGVEPVALCGFETDDLPSWPIDAVGDAVQSTGAHEVIVVSEDLPRSVVTAAIEIADRFPVHITVLPGLDHLLLSSLQLVTIAHEPGLSLEGSSLRTWQRLVKRGIDVTAAATLLLLTAPLLVSIAIAVRMTSSGPALFRQRREGKGGSIFTTYKYRTMRSDSDDEEPDISLIDGLDFLAKRADDSRMTRLGRFLRRSSIDELPQLWNVLRGEMSLVGPRPLPLWEAERLGLRRRMIVRPGITGLWQVSGRSDLSPAERVRLDLVYVQNWSLLLDLSILLRTVPAVIGRRGAY